MNTLAIEEAQQAINDGEEAKARRILARILLKEPHNEQVWLLLSHVVPVEKAIESLGRVLKINPDNQEAQNRLATLIPLFVPPIPTPNVSETGPVRFEASDFEATSIADQVPQITEKQTQQKSTSQPIDLSEEEFEELLKQSPKVAPQEGQEPENLGVSKQDLDEFFQQTDQNLQPAATSLEKSETELDTLFSQPSPADLSENVGETPSLSLGIQFPEIPSVEEKPISLEVSEEEIESLLSRLEKKSQVEAQIPAQGMAFGSNTEELLPQMEPVSASGEGVSPQLDGTPILTEQAVEQQSEAAITSLEQPLPESEQQLITEKQLTEHSIETPSPRKTYQALPPSAGPKKSKGIPKWVLAVVVLPIVGLILVVGGFVWYYYYGPCGIQRVQESTQQLLDIQKRWDSSLILATNSSRLVLTEPLVKLNDIRQELIIIPVPTCMQSAKQNLQNSMRSTIEAYISFLQYVSENDIRQKFNIAAKEMGEYVRKMQEIHNCAPFCSIVD